MAKMEDCKRNSSLLLAHCIHKVEKEFEKAGLSKYSFELRQKLEKSLDETFQQIEANNVSIASEEPRGAAAVSNLPTPCSPYYVPSSPSYAYSSYSPGNMSCSPFYTPSSPLYNPYSPEESADCSLPEETNVLSTPKRMNDNDLHQNTGLKRLKLDIPTDDSRPIAKEQGEQDESVEDNNGKGNEQLGNSRNERLDVKEEIVEEEDHD